MYLKIIVQQQDLTWKHLTQHKILLDKLYNYLQCKKCFLCSRGRRQILKLNSPQRSVYPEWTETIKSVPQGSVLGPLLFLIFIPKWYLFECCSKAQNSGGYHKFIVLGVVSPYNLFLYYTTMSCIVKKNMIN